MKIVLINPPSDCVDDDHLEPPLGLLYIASNLRCHGYVPAVCDLTGCPDRSKIFQMIGTIPEADIYGITCYCTNYRYVKDCIRHIQSHCKRSLIVLGGPNPSALPGFTLDDSGCDCVITGEGEDSFLDVVRLRENGLPIPGIIRGKGRSLVDTYEIPAWDLVDVHNYTRILDGGKAVSVVSSRGCSHSGKHIAGNPENGKP